MTAFLARRLLQAAATMLLAVSLVFVAVRVMPGNPLLSRFGQHVDPQQIEEMRRREGWDRPVWVQLGDYLQKVVIAGDFGNSFVNPNVEVRTELMRRIPATIELTLAAMLIAVPLGICAGVAAATWRNRFPDYLCMTGSLLGVSIPVFFLGVCLRAIFTGMPTSGRLSVVFDIEPVTGLFLVDALLAGDLSAWMSAAAHLCLPAVALSSIPTAIIARITRSSMLEVLSSDYVRTARSKGGRPWRVVWRHAFPNASIPITNIAGFQLGLLLSGAALTETVFQWPGMGRYMVEAVKANDYAIVQGGALVIAGIFVFTNLLLDVAYVWLDPRIRIS